MRKRKFTIPARLHSRAGFAMPMRIMVLVVLAVGLIS